uniref:Uncharacterized protein MANES_05G009100 n=1 Tax=Rhizophora mucronata TaxID=61149 RepID=A0A2P2J4J0_RHIMU
MSFTTQMLHPFKCHLFHM